MTANAGGELFVLREREVEQALRSRGERLADARARLMVFRAGTGPLGLETAEAAALVRRMTADAILWDSTDFRIHTLAVNDPVKLIWRLLGQMAVTVRSPSPRCVERFDEIAQWKSRDKAGSLRRRYGRPAEPELPPVLARLADRGDERWEAVAEILPECDGVSLWRFGEFGLYSTDISLTDDFVTRLVAEAERLGFSARFVENTAEIPRH